MMSCYVFRTTLKQIKITFFFSSVFYCDTGCRKPIEISKHVNNMIACTATTTILPSVSPCQDQKHNDEERSQIFILCKHCNFVHVNINHHVVGHLYKNKWILSFVLVHFLCDSIVNVHSDCDATKLKANVLLVDACHTPYIYLTFLFAVILAPSVHNPFHSVPTNWIWIIFLCMSCSVPSQE